MFIYKYNSHKIMSLNNGRLTPTVPGAAEVMRL